MKTSNNDTINQFIIHISLIDPIAKISNQLINDEFRDCDIKWLDSKLEGFTQLACKTLGLNITLPMPTEGRVMNDYVKGQYISRFNTLLNYFKTFA